jgi:hypothetical protein
MSKIAGSFVDPALAGAPRSAAPERHPGRGLAAECGYPSTFSKHRPLAERQCETYRLVVLFLAYTGVRFGEMAALRVGRIDLARRRAVIAESVIVVQGKGMVWGTPKTHQRREVPIPRFLAERLADHLVGKADEDLVFTGVRGGAGADVKVVQQMLGHSSATMTLDTYGHLFENRLDEVADALDQARATAQLAAAMDEQRAAELLDEESRVEADNDDEALPAWGVTTALAWADAEDPLPGVAPALPDDQLVDLASYRGRGKTAGQKRKSVSTPGRIRTCASASGGRRSIP